MHGYSLTLGTAVSHPWAKDLISEATAIVTFFRASTKIYADLRKLAVSGAAGNSTSMSLRSPNKTRFTSVHMCLESLIKLEPAFGMLLRQQPKVLDHKPEIKACLENREWWIRLELLVQVLAPFSQVIMAVQRDKTRLADTTRYWLYLVKKLDTLLPKLPAGRSVACRCGLQAAGPGLASLSDY